MQLFAYARACAKPSSRAAERSSATGRAQPHSRAAERSQPRSYYHGYPLAYSPAYPPAYSPAYPYLRRRRRRNCLAQSPASPSQHW